MASSYKLTLAHAAWVDGANSVSKGGEVSLQSFIQTACVCRDGLIRFANAGRIAATGFAICTALCAWPLCHPRLQHFGHWRGSFSLFAVHVKPQSAKSQRQNFVIL
jgi:hypothetical protein